MSEDIIIVNPIVLFMMCLQFSNNCMYYITQGNLRVFVSFVLSLSNQVVQIDMLNLSCTLLLKNQILTLCKNGHDKLTLIGLGHDVGVER